MSITAIFMVLFVLDAAALGFFWGTPWDKLFSFFFGAMSILLAERVIHDR